MKVSRFLVKRVKNTGRTIKERAQSGQAIVIMAFVAVALIAIMGLAIDGGRLLFLRRNTQNAADAAALAGMRALCQNNPNYINVGLAAAAANDFDNSGLNSERDGNVVEINAPPLHASIPISPECAGCYLEAIVTGEIPAGFIGIVYGGPLQATSKTIAACDRHLTGGDEVGLRAAFGLSDACEVDISGSNMIVEGGVHANGELQFNAAGTVSGPATYWGSLHLPSGLDIDFQAGLGSIDYNTLAGQCSAACFDDLPDDAGGGGGGSCDVPSTDRPYATCESQPDPLAYNLADFAPGGQYAIQAGPKYYTYIDQDCKSSDVEDWVESLVVGTSLRDGLYYTDCDVELNQNLLTGNITLVSEGTIHLSGGSQSLKPYMLDLLIFANGGSDKCSEKGVQFSGSSNQWWGNIYAPHGQAKFSASLNSSTINGCVVALDVDFSGSNNIILCSATEPDTTPGLFMPE